MWRKLFLKNMIVHLLIYLIDLKDADGKKEEEIARQSTANFNLGMDTDDDEESMEVDAKGENVEKKSCEVSNVETMCMPDRAEY